MIDENKLRTAMHVHADTIDVEAVATVFDLSIPDADWFCQVTTSQPLSAIGFNAICNILDKPMDEFTFKPHGGLVTWNEMLGIADEIAQQINTPGAAPEIQAPVSLALAKLHNIIQDAARQHIERGSE